MTDPGAFLADDGTLLNATFARIHPAKHLSYALSPDHPSGGHRTLVFERVLGSKRSNAADLEAAIRQGIRTTKAQPRVSERHGVEFIVDLLVRGPSGREAVVRTEWVYADGDDYPSPTTVFIRRRRSRGQTSTA